MFVAVPPHTPVNPSEQVRDLVRNLSRTKLNSIDGIFPENTGLTLFGTQFRPLGNWYFQHHYDQDNALVERSVLNQTPIGTFQVGDAMPWELSGIAKTLQQKRESKALDNFEAYLGGEDERMPDLNEAPKLGYHFARARTIFDRTVRSHALYAASQMPDSPLKPFVLKSLISHALPAFVSDSAYLGDEKSPKVYERNGRTFKVIRGRK